MAQRDTRRQSRAFVRHLAQVILKEAGLGTARAAEKQRRGCAGTHPPREVEKARAVPFGHEEQERRRL
eukprot:3188098-Pleurochrysis_carterae.AAC.1